MTIKIPMAKGRLAHRKFHNARVSGIQLARWEREETGRTFYASLKGGYSGFRRSFGRARVSTFQERMRGHHFVNRLTKFLAGC